MNLLSELKRRNVFRVSVAYLALGWLVTQVTATVAPVLHLPDWTLPLVVWIGVIGFPFVLFFSWVYELTPEGLKRERDVDRSASITHITGRRLDYMIIGMLALAILLFAFDHFGPGRSDPAARTSSAALPATTPAAAGEGGSVTAADDKSIAVLPFVNMSSDPEQEYFSDGLSEELLNLLAKIPQLRVTSRSSAFSFKGQKLEIPEIARRLNVGHILEGSVRKSGNRVRITAQLLEARSDKHLWSQTWDRTLEDIFAVQDEIAAAVVAQLKISLLGAAPKVAVTDPEAYALTLQARQRFRLGTAEGYEQSIALYQQALAIDPTYAVAWTGLAANYRRQANGGMRPIDEGYGLAREAASKALAIDPEVALAHAELGEIAISFDGDLVAAARHYERALALEPTDPDIIVLVARFALSLGRMDQAIALNEYAIARDPLNATSHFERGRSCHFALRLDEAIASFRTTLSLSPGRNNAQYAIGVALLRKGEHEAALAAMQQESSQIFRQVGLVMINHALGQSAASDAGLRDLIEKEEKGWSYNIAYVLAYRGEVDRAFAWLDKAVAYQDPGLAASAIQPEFANLHQDPRWLPFLRKLGQAPEQLAAIEFKVTLP